MTSGSFDNLFARPPAATSFTPGRVNLIGEHIDYNGGLVLPTALNIGVTVALGPNRGTRDRIASAQFDGFIEQSINAARDGSWADYAAGAAQKARSEGLLEGGADILVDSAIPHGAGVSSSAALMVGVLKAAASASGRDADARTIALYAQAAERDYVGVPCGVMDQMAVAIAKPGEALALDTKSLDYELIPIRGDWRFAVIHTGIDRALNDGRYGARRRECERAAEALGLEHLCGAPAGTLAQSDVLPAPLAQRARHAVSEHRRTVAAVAALKAGDKETFGRLMTESHASLRDDFEVSTPTVDQIVDFALAAGAPGARVYGARMTGGGFGGCIVALTDDPDGWFNRVKARAPAVRRIA